MRCFVALALLVAIALALPAASTGAHAQSSSGSVALLLSAEDYANYKPSEVGAARAQEIATLLKSRGFDVSSVTNPTNAAARAALRDLSTKVAGARLALVLVMGHGVSASGQTFFLPSNAEIERSTDLLSRGLSIANVAQIISSAKAGGVCFLMTSPNFPKPVEGVDFRPAASLQAAPNVALGVSNSPKIPLSRADITAAQSARDIAALLQAQPGADLKQLLATCAAQQQGTLINTPADVALTAPKPKPKPEIAAAPPPPPPPPPPATPPAEPPAVSDEMVQALQALEGMLDPRQVRRVQTKLTSLGLYQGPIDAIIGPLTRIAIKDYQKRTGQAETGFLTPAQLKALVEGVP
ncbi:MAG: peptidoglycan-binding protein [Hyphomicrobiaceae bacterium]|nr:peptidoglycan-binding protein [Hyphomicrobiaceae bacterium]